MKTLTILILLFACLNVSGQDYDELKKVVGDGVKKSIATGYVYGKVDGMKEASNEFMKALGTYLANQPLENNRIMLISQSKPITYMQWMDRFLDDWQSYKDECYADSILIGTYLEDCYSVNERIDTCTTKEIYHHNRIPYFEGFMEYLKNKYK